MNFICQKQPLDQLNQLARGDRHSVLIEGPQGCGKNYLAKEYAKMLFVKDFQEIEPKVDDIRNTIVACYQINNPVVIVINNLDEGVVSASYSLLKFLEEPMPHVYIVVTCRNINKVPDTIISRSAVVTCSGPVDIDISSYALSKDENRFKQLQNSRLWRCVRTFNDVDTVFNLKPEYMEYFTQTIPELLKFKDSVSNIVWSLSHFSDNKETPIELVIRYIMETINTLHVRRAGIECIRDLSLKRLGNHAVLSRFAFEIKYTE